MVNRAIPSMFFLDGFLHKKITVVISDDSVVAWKFQEESRKWYSRNEVRRKFFNAYTIPKAAHLMNININYLKEVLKNNISLIEDSYDIKTFAPRRSYLSEENMLELRQRVWDTLPKNRFGIPHKDVMTSAKQLEHLMKLGDDREFIKLDNDQVVRIFRDEEA